MKIIIILYDSKETNFSNNGLVILSDCISCSISEEINGLYECSLEYPLDERGKWKYLLEDNIIKTDKQLFRIYHKVKTLDSIKINARHIFYDLLDNFLEDVSPTNLTGLGALQYILTHTQYTHNFTAIGNVSGSNTKYFVRKNVADAIMGTDSILSTWGGELVRDNFSIGLWQATGNDNSVLIMGGKNLIGIEEDLNTDNLCTRLLPIGKDGLMLPEKYIDSPYINSYAHPKIKPIEFSDITDVATLRTTGQKYMLDNKIDIPLENFKADFIELSKTEEYKNYAILQTVDIGDTVTIRVSKLSMDLKAKVIKTTKNIITGRLEKVELGNFKGNIAKVLNNMGTTLANITTSDGQVKGNMIQGIIDATKTSFKAMSDSATPQKDKAILFEDRDINSPTYGSMALGCFGFEIASVMTNGEWQYSTFGTGKGFIADMLIAGKILGNNAEFNLDEGFLKVTHTDGSYTKIDSTGLNHCMGATKTEYHHLCEAASVTIPLSLVDGLNQGWVTVTLPAEFQGKNFKLTCEVTSTYADAAYFISYLGSSIPPVSINYDGGTFVMYAFYGNRKGDLTLVPGGTATVSYMAIA